MLKGFSIGVFQVRIYFQWVEVAKTKKKPWISKSVTERMKDDDDDKEIISCPWSSSNDLQPTTLNFVFMWESKNGNFRQPFCFSIEPPAIHLFSLLVWNWVGGGCVYIYAMEYVSNVCVTYFLPIA